ncbi:MAG TPA: alpha/beta hydrolase [Jatrophihabitans sp.]|jgi:pimeloyl-ACP methyl ester carboxylesterase
MADDGGLAALRLSDGVFLRYVELPGESAPVIWIHGWQCSSSGELLPAAVQPSLRGRRSLLVDLLGHGYSDKPDEFGYTLVEHARTIVELIDALALQDCVLVGHSMGGEIAIRVAAARPQLVSALVMVEGTLDPHGEEVFGGQSEEEFLRHGFADLIAALRADAEADPTSTAAVHLGLTEILEPRAVYRSDVSMRDGHDPSARSLLANLSIERWYLRGELTQPEPDFDALITDLGVSVMSVPNTGHAMGLQNPRGLADAVAAILAGTGQPTRGR